MKRASYRKAVEFIAFNDSAGDDDALDEEAVGCLVTSVLVSEIFGVPCSRVGRDVVRERERDERERRRQAARGRA